jgi:hypothetical protein
MSKKKTVSTADFYTFGGELFYQTPADVAAGNLGSDLTTASFALKKPVPTTKGTKVLTGFTANGKPVYATGGVSFLNSLTNWLTNQSAAAAAAAAANAAVTPVGTSASVTVPNTTLSGLDTTGTTASAAGTSTATPWTTYAIVIAVGLAIWYWWKHRG